MANQAPEFPFGPYQKESQLADKRRNEILDQLTVFPGMLQKALDGISQPQLGTVYRNWTIAQIVNHLADAQMNWFIRFKQALTTLTPAIASYEQSEWARLVDGSDQDLAPSLAIIDGVHQRWSNLAFSTPPEDYARTMSHPEHPEPLTMDHALSLANWHCYHHLAQIQWLRTEKLGLPV